MDEMIPSASTQASPIRWPVFFALGLLFLEITAIGLVFKHLIDFRCIDNWPPLACRTASRALISVYCLLGIGILLWMLRPAPLRHLAQSAGERPRALWVNLAGFTLAFTPLAVLSAPYGPLLSFVLWGISLTAILAGIALFVAPVERWRSFVISEWGALIPAIGAALLAPLLSVQLQPIWSIEWIADQTFKAVSWLMQMFNYDLVTDVPRKVIGADTFFISVAKVCSGIEGIALVTVFVSLYLWLFRAELRFPLAFLLYPIGILASVTFNVIRISVLLAIGLAGNPDLAVGGFHSHAGWLMFTLVSLGLIALAQSVPALRKTPTEVAIERSAPLPFFRDPVVARILPFAVFMFSALAASTFAQTPSVIYPIRVALMAGIVVLFWPLYRQLSWRIDPVAVAVGAFIGFYWVLIPVASDDTIPPYGALTGGLLLLWFVARGLGTIVFVPLIEEMFFRGYLEQRLRFGSRPVHLIGAAVVTSVLFAALHGRWAEAFVAGLLFSWVAWRRGNITDAVIAHATANALIFAVAVAQGNLAMI